MKYSKYPSYKDSGVDWLGEIPEGWSNWKLNHFTPIITCGVASTPEYVDSGVKFLSAQNIINNKVDLKKGHKYITEKRHSELTNIRTVRNGDLLMSRVGTIGNTCIVNVDFDFSIFVSLTHLRLNNSICSNIFFVYLTESQYFKELNSSETLVGGGVGNLNVNDLREYQLPLPPLQEQQTVANYLDNATAKIDTLIKKQTKLIELLKEKRQAVISRAVTRGLDETVAMKDSGVEWLDEIPEHWEVKKLKYVIQGIESGTSVNASNEPAMDNDYGVLKTSCVYSGYFRYKENKVVIEKEKDRVSCPLKLNTLIVSRMNTPDLVGAAGLVEEAPSNIFLPDRLWQVSFTISNHPKFIHYLTLTNVYRGYIHTVCAGTSSSMQNLSQDDFKDFTISIPSLNEQEEIVRYVDEKILKIDKLVAKVTKATDLLKEKRIALISAAVTGKIDVREIA